MKNPPFSSMIFPATSFERGDFAATFDDQLHEFRMCMVETNLRFLPLINFDRKRGTAMSNLPVLSGFLFWSSLPPASVIAQSFSASKVPKKSAC